MLTNIHGLPKEVFLNFILRNLKMKSLRNVLFIDVPVHTEEDGAVLVLSDYVEAVIQSEDDENLYYLVNGDDIPLLEVKLSEEEPNIKTNLKIDITQKHEKILRKMLIKYHDQ